MKITSNPIHSQTNYSSAYVEMEDGRSIGFAVSSSCDLENNYVEVLTVELLEDSEDKPKDKKEEKEIVEFIKSSC